MRETYSKYLNRWWTRAEQRVNKPTTPLRLHLFACSTRISLLWWCALCMPVWRHLWCALFVPKIDTWGIPTSPWGRWSPRWTASGDKAESWVKTTDLRLQGSEPIMRWVKLIFPSWLARWADLLISWTLWSRTCCSIPMRGRWLPMCWKPLMNHKIKISSTRNLLSCLGPAR